MNRLSGVAAVLLVMLIPACKPVPRAPPDPYKVCGQSVERGADGRLKICGRLTAQMTEAVIRELKPEDSEVLMTSGGGFATPAIALVKALNDHRITVRVRDFCLSACSTYVLLAAHRIVIEPGAVVAFHHTGAFALEAFAYRSGLPVTATVLQPARDERVFFTEQGLDPALLDRIAMAIEPRCFGLRRTEQGRERYLNSDWAWFVPSRSEAETMFRGRIVGYWPSSAAEAQQALRALVEDDDLRVKYGALPAATAPSVVAATLPTCQGSLPEWSVGSH